MIDEGLEHDLYWVVMITETGEIWQFANKFVREQKNITAGRLHPTMPLTPRPRLTSEFTGKPRC